MSASSVSKRLLGFLQLARPHNVLVSILNTLVGVLTVAWITGCEGCLSTIGYALLAVMLVSAGGYAINDYFDADIDAIEKPYRPIPSGRVTHGEAYAYALLLLVAGILAGFLASPLHGVYALLVALLLYLYPWRVKRRNALLGHLIVAFTGASTIVYGGLAVGVCCGLLEALEYSLIPAAYAFLLILAREFVKALEDRRGDALRGARTIATVYGEERARLVALALLFLVAVLAPLPVLLGPYTVLYLVPAGIVAGLCLYSMVLILGSRYSSARRVLKIAFGLGGLAFLLDPLRGLVWGSWRA